MDGVAGSLRERFDGVAESLRKEMRRARKPSRKPTIQVAHQLLVSHSSLASGAPNPKLSPQTNKKNRQSIFE